MCSYHPDIAAVGKCERCYRQICNIGKRTYQKTYSQRTDSHRQSLLITHTYCPPCHAEVVTQDDSWPLHLMSHFVFILLGLVITFALFVIAGPLGFIPLILVGIGVFQALNRSKKADDARLDKKRFLYSLMQFSGGFKET